MTDLIERLRAMVGSDMVPMEKAMNLLLEAANAIEALRAELETAKGQAEFYRTQRNAQQRKAARLEEALQWYVDNDDTNEGQEGNEFWLAGRDRARALLREQQEDYWPKLEGKGGTDWTGFDG